MCFPCTKERIPTILCKITSPKWISIEEAFQTRCICLCLHTPSLSPRSASQNVIQYRAQFLRAPCSQLWPQLITSFTGLIHFLRVGSDITHDMDYVMGLKTFIWTYDLWNNANVHSRWMPEETCVPMNWNTTQPWQAVFKSVFKDIIIINEKVRIKNCIYIYIYLYIYIYIYIYIQWGKIKLGPKSTKKI